MKSITNAQALWIIESIVYARKCRQYAMFHEGTSNRCPDGLRFTVEGFDHDRHRIYFTVKKAGLPAAHNVRVISKDGEGEYFTFLGVKYHAWQFVTWQEHEAIMEDFFTHYRISDSRTPHLGHVGGRCGQAMFEDALVMSGLPYGDNVDA